VTLFTSAYFESLARGAGLDFVGLGNPEDYKKTVDDPDLWDPKLGFRVFARRVVIPAMRPLYEILSESLALLRHNFSAGRLPLAGPAL
jgi:hypothetical protein